MKVLLIDTGTPRREYSEPIGIETLASYIPEETELRLMSIELNGYEAVVSEIKLGNFDIIGISSKIGSFDLIKKLIKYIQSSFPETVICIGDIYGTYAYEQILEWNQQVICMIGEGEDSIPALINAVSIYRRNYRLALPHIKSIAYYDSGIRINERAPVFDVTTARMPLRSLLPEIIKKNGIAHLEGSRGCIYGRCSFCGVVQKYGSHEWRPFPEAHIYRELISLSDAGIISPYFTDEDFFGNDIERVFRIANEIIKLKLKGTINPELNFYFNMRVDSVVGNGHGGGQQSLEALKLLKKAGLREVFIGVESGSVNQIGRYKKNNQQSKSIRAVMILNSLSIDADIGFILFDPFMSLDDLENNLDFIAQAGIGANYSRLAKKLRVEPLTPFAKEHNNSLNISHSLDMNSVSFPYTFIDDRVEWVYRVFSAWEKEDLDFIYNLQSFCRGEVPNEDERRRAKNIISMYRSLDQALLRKLTACARAGTFKKEEEIMEYYRSIRKQYDLAMRDTIEDIVNAYRPCCF